MWLFDLIVRIWRKMVNGIKEALVEWGLGEIDAVQLIDEVNVEDGDVLILRASEIAPQAQKELAMRMMEEYKDRGHDILIIPKDRDGFNLSHIDDMEEARELLNRVHSRRKKLKSPGDPDRDPRSGSEDLDDSSDTDLVGTQTGRVETGEEDKSKDGKVVEFPNSEGSESP